MKSLLIAHNTFREAMRDRLMAGVLVAGALMMLITQAISPLALGEARRLTVDLGLSSISLLGLLVILLVGTSLVAKEIERRTIFNLLSRPIARGVYLVGKWAGLSGALWATTTLLTMALCAVLMVRGYGSDVPAVLQAGFFSALELSVVTAIAVLFSALSTPVLSALYTLGVWLVGQWTYDLRGFADRFPAGLKGLIRMVADLAPNLPLFNLRTLAAEGRVAPALHVLTAVGYAALYVACALALASAALERREFK